MSDVFLNKNFNEGRFFSRKILTLYRLAEFLPKDSGLLKIPYHSNFADSSIKSFLKFSVNHNKNNLLIGLNLVNFLQYINSNLSLVFAAHNFIKISRDTPVSGDSQGEIDREVCIRSYISSEYRYGVRDFILNLRVVVDQLILLITREQFDSIGNFFKSFDKVNYDGYGFDLRFLAGLNLAANYLKHHEFQFEGAAMVRQPIDPSLFILVENRQRDRYEFSRAKNYFASEICFTKENTIGFWLSLPFLVSGFNRFFDRFQELCEQVTDVK